MQTIKNAFGRGDSTKVTQEPLSGETGAGIATDPYDAGNAHDQPGPAADDSLEGTTAGIAALTTEDSSPPKQEDTTTSGIVEPTSAEPANPTATTGSTDLPSIPSEPSSTTNPPTNHISDPPHPDLETSKAGPADTNGTLSGTLDQPTSSIDVPPSSNNVDAVEAPVSEEPVSGEKPLGEEKDASIVEPPVSADPISSEKPLEEQGTSVVEPPASADPVSSEKPLEEQDTSVVEPPVSADPVSNEKPLETEQSSSTVEPPVNADPVSSEKPLEAEKSTGVVEPSVSADPVSSEKPLEPEQGINVTDPPVSADPVSNEKSLEAEQGASVAEPQVSAVEPPVSADPVPNEKPLEEEKSTGLGEPQANADADLSEKPLEAEKGASIAEPPAAAHPISDQKPLQDEAANNSLEESIGKDAPTGTEGIPPTEITQASGNLPEAPSDPPSAADAPVVPDTGTGTVEPSVNADPASDQVPSQKEQGADRPLEEPAGEQAAAVTEEKAKTEDTQASSAVSGAPPATGISDSADQSGKPLDTVSQVTEEKDVEGESKGSGTGEQYVKSTGVAADGGDFDATKPGAGKEADRLLEEPGTTNNATSSDAIASEETEDPDTGKKPSLGTKIKDKLHIGKH